MSTSSVTSPEPRLQSVDAVRGIAMLLMAIDHVRDFIDHRAMLFSPTDLARTSIPLFLTRWITHMCAPVFILTAGISAYLWMSRGHRSRSELSLYLFTRGLVLIVLELTVLRLIMFSSWPFTGSPVLLIILWAIGVSMIALAALVYLPVRVLAIASVAIIAGHNLLDGIEASRFGAVAWLWNVLHQPGAFRVAHVTFISAYPVLPWIAVMSSGFCLGHAYRWTPARRARWLTMTGFGVTACFVLLRLYNSYGDPSAWSKQASFSFSVLSFLNVTKYPPSLDFLLMTLGPALFALAALEQRKLSEGNPLIVFGRVPLFYYVAHLFLAHTLAILLNLVRYGWKTFVFIAPPSMGSPPAMFPVDYGFPLAVSYLVWVAIVAMLYPTCRWYAGLKRRHRNGWLTYV
ncbi:DUF1624 domain-containing protein [Acidipila sp. EB88]|uniref:DUF1624 domain-containing protein n=1 Tax=Acidipila sp. EB88 TaxID=2305226 RepID=UPI000F5D6DF9|nr:heparan-alpha-glucosaminide N-acetyltransferase domain-containing protein [Acidipila sp. EB88]RRA47148.1 DUF1624 domain-containing protein [Acidipila sp. EB88]